MARTGTVSRLILATPGAVYRAFTTSIGLLDWVGDAADLAARPGGHVFLWAESGYRLLGNFSELEEDRRIVWQVGVPAEGTIEMRIRPEEEGSRVVMTFSGQEDPAEQIDFWDPALDNLRSVLGTGLDRRVYDRPMLGILIGGSLDPENQSKYKTPVPYGVIVSGTVDGMGAQAMGLADNDVLVEMGGVRLENYPALRDALEGYKAGEEIRAVWYRGAQRMEGVLRLSGRPEPHIPETPSELGDYVEKIYDRLDAELDEILDGATEEEAQYRTGEKEWNAKEIVAHAIATERGTQIWIAGAIDGDYLHSWASNENSLVKAIAEVHPTLDDLRTELHRTERLTVAMLRRLAPEILEHKGVYTGIVTMLGEHGLPVHSRMHYETIRGLLREARGVLERTA